MEPPALSFIPNTQGSSARPPHPSSGCCCPRPLLGPGLGQGGVGVGVLGPGRPTGAGGQAQNLLLTGKLGPTGTPSLCLKAVGWAGGKELGLDEENTSEGSLAI